MENDCTQKKKILIVDDSKLNQLFISDLLGEAYEYLYADDGLQAFELLNADTPVDIILLDIYMPNMNGLELLELIYEHRWTDQIPVIAISAETDSEVLQRVYDLGATDYISRPFRASTLQHRVENSLKLYGRQSVLVSLVREQVFEREKINSMMINIFSHVIETRNLESGNHTMHMQAITSLLLRRLIHMTDAYRLSEKDISMISTVAALHDIGKIAIPESILNKPGRLTDEERAIMQTHTLKGDALLNGVSDMGDEKYILAAREICRWHHERWDGSGYPDGLRGNEIPISAQVVSIADVYDALTSERCYKKAYSHEEAMRMICDGSCGAFNPILVQCLKDISNELLIRINLNMEKYDYLDAAQQMAAEMLAEGQRPQADRSFDLAQYERVKKNFFAAQCGGIQFEYDKERQKLLYIHRCDSADAQAQENVNRMLSDADCEKLREYVRAATREKPDVEMQVQVCVNGNWRWHRLKIRTIWADGGAGYIGLVGQFTETEE